MQEAKQATTKSAQSKIILVPLLLNFWLRNVSYKVNNKCDAKLNVESENIEKKLHKTRRFFHF